VIYTFPLGAWLGGDSRRCFAGAHPICRWPVLGGWSFPSQGVAVGWIRELARDRLRPGSSAHYTAPGPLQPAKISVTLTGESNTVIGLLGGSWRFLGWLDKQLAALENHSPAVRTRPAPQSFSSRISQSTAPFRREGVFRASSIRFASILAQEVTGHQSPKRSKSSPPRLSGWLESSTSNCSLGIIPRQALHAVVAT